MKTKKQKPVVYLGTDHAGLDLKNDIKGYLVKKGYHVHDVGAFTVDPQDDYPDFILPAAAGVAQSPGSFGIVFGGSGIGECIAANKVRGIRCALAYDVLTAKLTREHNDANMLSLGSRTVTGDLKLAKRIVDTFLATPFSNDARHKRRISKIASFEQSAKRSPKRRKA